MERYRFRDLVRERLLQAEDLRRVPEIANPQEISAKQLDLWLDFAREVCSTHGFLALAFTELKPEARDFLGFSENLPPRVIFYREKVEEDGVLIINPQAEIPVFGNPKIPQLEGCGSMDFGKSLYFIKRPEVSVIRGFFYDEYGLKQGFYEPKSIYDDRSIHEIDHLNGHTALDFPKDFMDIRQKGDWEQVLKAYSNLTDDFLRNYLLRPEGGIVIYDRREKKYLHITAADIFPKK